MSTVQRVSREAALDGSQGWSSSGKNGNMLPSARGTSMWTLVPSLKAFITCEQNWLGAVNQRRSDASPPRGSTPRWISLEGSQA